MYQQEEEETHQMEFEEFVYHLNRNAVPRSSSPASSKTSPLQRLDPHHAQHTMERCMRRVQKLRRDLLLQGMLHRADQRFTGHNLRHVRVVAPFVHHEIRVGGLLGHGGFSSVFEITAFDMSREQQQQPQLVQGGANSMALMNEGIQLARQHVVQNVHRPMQVLNSGNMAASADNANGNRQVSGAMVTSYAIKHLRRQLIQDPARFERAALDLVLETQLLMVMDHPHIIALRGWSQPGVKGLLSGRPSGYFIILDRLAETLEDRILTWREALQKYQSKFRNSGKRPRMFGGNNHKAKQQEKNALKFQNLLGERLLVAHQVASALEYMHSWRIVNRDLKTTNIGFDQDGVLKLFDFGLSRLLPAPKPQMADSYRMSRVGTKYYMAPEVHQKLPYNEKADVFSFGIVAWELLSLGHPREVLRQYKNVTFPPDVSSPLPMCPCWPVHVSQALRASLCMDPQRRPSMQQARMMVEHSLIQNLGTTPSNMEQQRQDQQARRPSLRMDLSRLPPPHHSRHRSSAATTTSSSMDELRSLASSQRDAVSTIADHDYIGGASTIASSTLGDSKNTKQTDDTKASASTLQSGGSRISQKVALEPMDTD